MKRLAQANVAVPDHLAGPAICANNGHLTNLLSPSV